MSFPTYEYRVTQQDGGHGNTMTAYVPDGAVAGDLIIVSGVYGWNQGWSISSAPGTWDLLYTASGYDMYWRLYTHVVTGDEAGWDGVDDSIVVNGRDAAVMKILKVPGGEAVKVTGLTNINSATLDLPALDVTAEFGGAGDYLWFADISMGQGYSGSKCPGAPTGFTTVFGPSRTGNACTRLSVLEQNAAVVDPGPAVANGSEWHGGIFYAVKAAGGGKKRGQTIFIMPGL